MSNTAIFKNYYKVLHVQEGSAIPAVKQAYRALVKRLHPDVAQTGDHEQLLAVYEAYAVLHDRRLKAHYDAQLAAAAVRGELSSAAFSSATVPASSELTSVHEHGVDIIYSRNLFELARRGVLRGKSLSRKRRKQYDINYDIILKFNTRYLHHARLIHIAVPMKQVCPVCSMQDSYCSFCSGKGYIIRPSRIGISIAPHVQHGEILTVDLAGIKKKNLSVARAKRLRIKILLKE